MQFFIVNVFYTLLINSMIDSQADRGIERRERETGRVRETKRDANREKKRRRQIEMQTDRDRQANGWTDRLIIIRETEKFL